MTKLHSSVSHTHATPLALTVQSHNSHTLITTKKKRKAATSYSALNHRFGSFRRPNNPIKGKYILYKK